MTLEDLHNEYWALRAKGHGIIGAQVVVADRYGIPLRYMTQISHPRS
jgi:hypothetical protein